MTILIAEDEKPIADTIIYRLETDGFAVKWVATGTDAIASVTSESPDLLILDIGLPDMTGLDVCRTIRKTSDLPILFLTARSEEIDRILGLELGGDDYLTKPFSPRELSARVRAILRRAAPKVTLEPSVSVCSVSIDESRKRAVICGTEIDLAKQEFRILATLVHSPKRVFSREELMDIAWDEPGYCTDRAVDAHIKSIRAKIRAVTDLECVVTHRGFGYSFQEPIV